MPAMQSLFCLSTGLRRVQSAISSWGTGGRPGPRGQAAAAERVRAAMREIVAGLTGPRVGRIAFAVASSRDLASLWYLRVTLMQAMAGEHGETAARQRIAALDALFLQAWPGAPVIRD